MQEDSPEQQKKEILASLRRTTLQWLNGSLILGNLELPMNRDRNFNGLRKRLNNSPKFESSDLL